MKIKFSSNFLVWATLILISLGDCESGWNYIGKVLVILNPKQRVTNSRVISLSTGLNGLDVFL